MSRFFVFVLASFVSFSSQALRIENALLSPSGLSAARPRNTSYLDIARSHDLFSQFNNSGRDASVYGQRTSLQKVNWLSVPAVSAQDLQHIFEHTRDRKLLKDSQRRSRRLTWLFPDNGCYARAELMNSEAERMGQVVPVKVFAFGDLVVETPFHPYGEVTWWYHVAPVLRVGIQVYVLDPAMESRRPLTIEEWAQRMTNTVEISVCSAHSYDPDSLCAQSTDQSKQAVQDEAFFLEQEWNRLLSLGRNPEDELGDRPPWL